MSKEIAVKEEKNIKNTRAMRSAVPAVDIYENQDGIVLYADMPGVNKEEISVNIDKGTLTLSGGRRFDPKGVSQWTEFTDLVYTRSFSIPQTIDIQRVEAELRDGVLRLSLPKTEAAKPRMIEIKAA